MSEFNLPTSNDHLAVRLTPLQVMELERRAHAERARAIGELIAGAIVWLVRLPRRVADLMVSSAPRQRA